MAGGNVTVSGYAKIPGAPALGAYRDVEPISPRRTKEVGCGSTKRRRRYGSEAYRNSVAWELAAEGAIDADDYKVPCKIEEPEDAIETSLAENTIRAAMHPADAFVAMAALIDGGATIDDVVRRFGCSERHVRQRLRLGKLAPRIARGLPCRGDRSRLRHGVYAGRRS